MNTIVDRIKKTIDEHGLIPEGAHVVLGLSGGPDSLCLFDVLLKLRDETGITLHAVHVNHELRGEDADRDQEFCEKICIENDVPLDVTVFDCAETAKELGITTEEAGRIKRYGAFDDAADRITEELENEALKDGDDAGSIPGVVIAVAHNYDDQAETIMFRLMRGTGPDGLAGMEYGREDERGYMLIRPLLDCRKSEILGYCEEEGLEPRIDETNDEAVYSRNEIRLEIFPYLEERSPGFRDALIRLGDIAREDKAFLRSLAEEVFSYALLSAVKGETITLDGRKLRKIAGPVRRRVIALAASRIGLTEDLTAKHYESIDHVIEGGSPSAGVDLPHGYRLSSVYGDIRIAAPDQNGDFLPPGDVMMLTKAEFERLLGGSFDDGAPAGQNGGDKDALREQSFDDGAPAGQNSGARLIKGRYAAFDLDALELKFGKAASDTVCWRCREAGDYIVIKGTQSMKRSKDLAISMEPVNDDGTYTKKIQDIFVDDKIPKDDRGRVYFAAVGKEVLFIPVQPLVKRGRWAAGYEVTQGTKRVLVLTV